MADTLNIAVAPASTKTGAATIRSLFAQAAKENISISIRAFYRNLAKAPEEFTSKPNFQAIKGDIADSKTLDFQGVDSVVTITPPDFESSDIVKEAERLSANVRKAFETAGCVKKLVLLSSVAAHLEHGVVSPPSPMSYPTLTRFQGEIKTNNAAERIFRTATVPHKTFVRCAYFMENWTMFPDGLKAPDPFFYSTVTPVDYRFPMIAIKDIGETLAHEALTIPKEETARNSDGTTLPRIYELHGPEDYTPMDVKAVLSKAINKEVEIRPVEQKDLDEFFGHIFPPDTCAEWAEMAKCFLPGGVAVENPPQEEESQVVRGESKLQDVLEGAVEGLV